MDGLSPWLRRSVPEYFDVNVELAAVLAGASDIALADWKRITKYDARRDRNSKTVVAFWEVMRDCTPELRRQVWEFATGMKRFPDPQTLVSSRVYFKISIVQQDDSTWFPQAHTCFNQLCLMSGYGGDTALIKRRLVKAVPELVLGLQ